MDVEGGGGGIILWSQLWETVSRLVTGTPLDDILKPPVPNVDFSSVAWR